MTYPRVSALKTADDLRSHLHSLGLTIPFDETIAIGPNAPLARAYVSKIGTIGNRFCILPMEGWDGTPDGKPTELTRRRWENFGTSGAKLIWGGEAAAVRHDGRANPNQLIMNDANLTDIAMLRELLVRKHVERFGSADDLLVGLQLTHSGRYARPNEKKKAEPRTLYRHPILDARVNITSDAILFSDDEIEILIGDIIAAGKRAQSAGFAFVDVKHCHGYLGHEFLTAFDRPGKFGGSFENRTRFLREVTAGLRAEAPGLGLGVRLSVFDMIPFKPGPDNIGIPETTSPYAYAFGADASGMQIDLTEPAQFVELMMSLGMDLVCTTAGSPYYTPHLQRPAAFPPSDGYQPPEDPFVGVARQIDAVAELKRRFPTVGFVGSGLSYLQEWLPNVGQRLITEGMTDFIGYGRMVLSYPDLPADVLAGKPLERKKICRTFSDCTTAPRQGLISGCYPLDPFYKNRPERLELTRLKK